MIDIKTILILETRSEVRPSNRHGQPQQKIGGSLEGVGGLSRALSCCE